MLARKKLVTTLVGGAIAAATVATASPAMAADFNPIAYDANGSTRIGAQVNQTVQLGPSRFNGRIDFETGNIDQGTLPLPSKVVTFPVFGGLAKLSATVNFIQAAPITGKFTSADTNTLTANAKYTIKLTNASAKVGILPAAPLVIGNNCRTTSPVSLNLKTPAGQNFDVLAGGTIAGNYTIGQFTGCNILLIPGLGSLVVNALVPGSNNSATINLSNGTIG